mmetsp:Transcript_20917/g.62358  ORF Transcript_20917/g.62358 Transcript_20917/m.62358 type:complete len:270 (+) Transcript_20917:1742-2551(+)
MNFHRRVRPAPRLHDLEALGLGARAAARRRDDGGEVRRRFGVGVERGREAAALARRVERVRRDEEVRRVRRDVVVEVVLEPVGADVLHGTRHAVLDALHPQRVGRPRVVRDERHPRGAHLRRGEARRAGLRAELDDALALYARAVAPQQRQREEPVGGRARAGAVIPHQHAADLHALVVPGRAGLGAWWRPPVSPGRAGLRAWWRRRVCTRRTHVLVAAVVQIVEFRVVREARHSFLSCAVCLSSANARESLRAAENAIQILRVRRGER